MPARVLGVGIRATAANVWTAIQTFGSGLLKLRNPANTFDYIFKGGAIVADRDVTMPLLTGNDTFVTEGMAQTLSNKTLTAPDINGGTADALTSLAVRSTGTGAFDLKIANAENLTVGAKTLTVQVGDADRTLILGASPSLSGSNTGDQTITLTGDVTGTGTGSFTATVASTHAGTAHHTQSHDHSGAGDGTTLAPAAITGWAIGSNVQAYDADLTTLAAAFASASAAGAASLLFAEDTDNGTSAAKLQGAAALAADITLTLPATADTLVGRDTTDTLTNKTLTSPVINTQLTGTAVGTGASQVAAGDHTHVASGALTRAGGNSTEATTTSTSAVSLLTTSSLSIGASVPLEAFAFLRKTTGAANTASAGLMANTTTLVAPVAWCDNGNENAGGGWYCAAQSPATSYDRAGFITVSGPSTLTSARIALWTVETITSFIVRGLVADAAITMGADEMHVYTRSIS